MNSVCVKCGHKLCRGEDRWCVGLHEYVCSSCHDPNPKVKRGGIRPGAGRKPLKSSLKKQKKAFSLSPESVQALENLQESFGLGSESAVVEYLVLKAFRESVRSDRRKVVERQFDLF